MAQRVGTVVHYRLGRVLGEQFNEQAEFLWEIQVRAIEAILEWESVRFHLEAHRPAGNENIQEKLDVIFDFVPHVGDRFGVEPTDRVVGAHRFFSARLAQVKMTDGSGRQQGDLLPRQRDGAPDRVINQQRFRPEFHASHEFSVGQFWELIRFDHFCGNAFALQRALQRGRVFQRKIFEKNAARFHGHLNGIGFGQRFERLDGALELVSGWRDINLEDGVGHVTEFLVSSEF